MGWKSSSDVAGKRAGGFRWQRRWRGALCAILVLYLCVVAVFYSLQSTLIFPGSWRQGRASARIAHSANAVELVTLRSHDGQSVQALFARALNDDGSPRPDAAERPVIVYFYGNGDSLTNALEQIEDMRRLGANVMAADYLGYGMSSGKASEQACYDTATAEYHWLVHARGVPSRKIIACGWSLGAAVAADLAAREPVAGLMMFSAFTSMADAARANYPWLPIGPLLKHRFESLEKLPRVHCPVLLAHGERDRLVPHGMLKRLAAAAPGPVEMLDVPHAGHNDFWHTGRQLVLPAIARMVERVASGGEASRVR